MTPVATLPRLLFIHLLLLPIIASSSTVRYLSEKTIKEGIKDFQLDVLTLIRQEMPTVKRVSFYKEAYPFAIESGVIILRGSLDREQLCRPGRPSACDDNTGLSAIATSPVCCVRLRLEARDGLAIREFHVRIVVEDVNDSPPSYETYVEQRFFSISEGAPIGHEISLPTATDADSKENGVKEYHLADTRPNGTFESYFDLVDASPPYPLEPKLRVKRLLDREQVAEFSFVLVAVDKGEPQLSGSLTLTVEVKDINDQRPEIVDFRPDQRIIINETDARHGKLTVATFKVIDRDDKDNGRVTCQIRSTQGSPKKAEQYFELSQARSRGVPEPGVTFWELRSVAQLDYEEVRSFSFNILASDNGSPRLSSSVSVQVILNNIDDQPTQIAFWSQASIKHRVEVLENQAPGVMIATVEARDGDIERPEDYRRIECKLVTNAELFHLEEKPLIDRVREYHLRTAATFDRERQDSYIVSVACRDTQATGGSATSTLVVSIGDLNDSPPTFERPLYRGTVEENALRRTPVAMDANGGRVKATDQDAYPNNQIVFRLSGEDSIPFKISPQGEILVDGDIDYERKRIYKFNITASNENNETMASMAEIQIHVVDLNDNPPIIIGYELGYKFSVKEETAHVTIGEINATDEDTLPENRELQFRILSPADSRYSSVGSSGLAPTPDALKYFYIEPRTGKLRVIEKIDRETHPHFQFRVLAENQRKLVGPKLHSNLGLDLATSPSITTVNVQVININDHAPHLCRVSTSSSLASAPTNVIVGRDCREPAEPILVHFSDSAGIIVGQAVRGVKCVPFPYDVRDPDDSEAETETSTHTIKLVNLTEVHENRVTPAEGVEFGLEGPQNLCLKQLPSASRERQEFRMRISLTDEVAPKYSRAYDCHVFISRTRHPPPLPGNEGRQNVNQYAETNTDKRHFVIVVSLVTVVVFLIVFAFAFVLFFYVRRLDSTMNKECESDRGVTEPLKTPQSQMGPAVGGVGLLTAGSGTGTVGGGHQRVTLLYSSRTGELISGPDHAIDHHHGLPTGIGGSGGGGYNSSDEISNPDCGGDSGGGRVASGRYEIWREHSCQPTTHHPRQQQQHHLLQQQQQHIQLHLYGQHQAASGRRATLQHATATESSAAAGAEAVVPGTGPTLRRPADSRYHQLSSSCENLSPDQHHQQHLGRQVAANYQTIDPHCGAVGPSTKAVSYQRLMQQQHGNSSASTGRPTAAGSAGEPIYSPKRSLKSTYFETSFV